MKRYNRIIFKDDSVINDLSTTLGEYYSDSYTLPIVASDDYLYLGSYLPFNNRWVEVTTGNDQSSVLTVEIWDGNDFEEAVDLVDETSVGGKTFKQSGYIYFTVDRNNTWDMESTTEDITGLSTLKIYDLYWIRLKFSGNLSETTAIKHIGWKFGNDTILGQLYPSLILSDFISAFESGKTNWDSQHFIAADETIKYLQSRKNLWSRNQILDPARFELAATYKTAEIIFRSMGDDYEDQKIDAAAQFKKYMNSPVKDIDKTDDGRLDQLERSKNLSSRITRI